MREKMHFSFKQQQNKVSVIENFARATAKVMEAIQKNNTVEQNKVSVVIEKIVVENKGVAGSVLATKQGDNVGRKA